MRLSLRSVGILTAAVVTFALAPENWAARGPERAVAQDKPKVKKPIGPGQMGPPVTKTGHDQDGEATAAAKERRSASVFRLLRDHPLSSDTGRTPQIEAALEETVAFEIEPQPIRDALDLLAAKFRIPIVADKRTFGDADVSLLQEVKLDVQGLTLQDTLDLLLSTQTVPLSFEIRHGTLLISTVEQIKEDLQVVVYDCRDLAPVRTIDHYPSEKTQPAAAGGAVDFPVGGMFQAPQDAAKLPAAAESAPLRPAAAAAPVPAPAPAVVPQSRAPAAPRLPLVRTIMAAVDPDSWEEGATITELCGLLVVRQNPINHDKIKTLLADIRRMRADGAFASFAKDHEAEAKRRDEQEAHKSGRAAKAVERPPIGP